MLFENYTEINDDIVDAVGELTNMIAGQARAQLSQQGMSFDASTPAVVKGKGHTIDHITSAPILSIPFFLGRRRPGCGSGLCRQLSRLGRISVVPCRGTFAIITLFLTRAGSGAILRNATQRITRTKIKRGKSGQVRVRAFWPCAVQPGALL